MGNTFTVTYWAESIFPKEKGQYCTYQYWQGESLLMAMYQTWKAKREYPNCVKFEWR